MNTPMVTPADVPTDSPTSTPSEQLAPGVFPSGVYNASALAHAHFQILSTTSFTIRTNQTYRYPNGTLAGWSTGTVRVSTEPSLRLRSRSRVHKRHVPSQNGKHSTIVRLEKWSGPDHAYQRITFANNTTTYQAEFPIDRGHLYRWSRAWNIERILTDVETRVTRIIRNDSTYYRIEGPISPDYGYFPNRRNASQWLLIDSRGVVYEHHIIANTTGPTGKPLRMRITITYKQIGNTTVKRPAWVDIARNRTKPVNRTTTAG